MNLILVKPVFFQIGKKLIFSQKIQHLLHSVYMTLAFIFGVNKYIIQVNNNKNIEFLGQNLIDIALEAGQSVG